MVALSHPMIGLPSYAVFQPTIQTVDFQTAFSGMILKGRARNEVLGFSRQP